MEGQGGILEVVMLPSRFGLGGKERENMCKKAQSGETTWEETQVGASMAGEQRACRDEAGECGRGQHESLRKDFMGALEGLEVECGYITAAVGKDFPGGCVEKLSCLFSTVPSPETTFSRMASALPFISDPSTCLITL